MCYELIHQSTKISRTFSRQFWSKAIELARLYGWKPMGTLPPPGFDFYKEIADWLGIYLTNDGQTVRTVDAIWLADALEKSLGDIPDVNIKAELIEFECGRLKMAEKAGAVREALLRNRLRHHGSPCDAYMHSLIPGDLGIR